MSRKTEYGYQIVTKVLHFGTSYSIITELVLREGAVFLKILVISDTHGKIENAVSLIKRINPDYTFHLGDMADDCRRLEALFPAKVIASVKGNNDYFDKEYPLERIVTLGEKKFFICHGHKYNVKTSLLPITYKARELGADVVLFGHTHKALAEDADGLTVLNPGSTESYGIIEIEKNEIYARVEKYVP